MKDFLWILPWVFAVIGLVLFVMKRGVKISERLQQFAASVGVQSPRVPRFSLMTTVSGMWNGEPLAMRYAPRNKSTPARIVLELGTRAEGRLIVRARKNKPWMVLFEPPVFPLRDAVLDQELYVRTDQPMLAERIVYDREIVDAMRPNLLCGHDRLTIGKRRIVVQRALDEPQVKAKFGQPTFQIRFNDVIFDAVLREEWQLVQLLGKKLG